MGWGIAGAAIATAVSMCLGGTMMFAAALRHPLLNMRSRKLQLDKPVLSEIVRVGIPVTLNRVVTCMGQVVFTLSLIHIWNQSIMKKNFFIWGKCTKYKLRFCIFCSSRLIFCCRRVPRACK